MVGTFALVAATILAISEPSGVTDLRVLPDHPNAKGVAMQETQVGIAWHFTVPAFNDSSQCNTWLPKLVQASDSVTYHYEVWGLPIPYQWVVQDSFSVARGDSVRMFFQAWIDKNYITKHWLSRTSGEPPEYVPVCDRRTRRMMLRIASYP